MSLDVVKQWTLLDIHLLKQLLNKHSCFLTVFSWLFDNVSCWRLQSLPKCIFFFFLKQSLCVCAMCFILFIMFLFLSKSTWNNVPQSPPFCPPPHYQDWLHSSGTQCSMWTVRYLSALWVISFYLPYLAHYQVITQ